MRSKTGILSRLAPRLGSSTRGVFLALHGVAWFAYGSSGLWEEHNSAAELKLGLAEAKKLTEAENLKWGPERIGTLKAK